MNEPVFRKAVDLQPSDITEQPVKILSEAAKRALAEAEERRKFTAEQAQPRPVEEHGRGGLDPVRYDDWEIGGLAVDF